jgi:hypothetical protein
MTAAVTTETTKTLIFMPLIYNARLYTEIEHRYIPNNMELIIKVFVIKRRPHHFDVVIWLTLCQLTQP